MRETLKEALHRFRDLLVPPKLAAHETETDRADKMEENLQMGVPERVPDKPVPGCNKGIRTTKPGSAEKPASVEAVCHTNNDSASSPNALNKEEPPLPCVEEPKLDDANSVLSAEEPELDGREPVLSVNEVVIAEQEPAEKIEQKSATNEHQPSESVEEESRKKFVITESELKTLDSEVVENNEETVLDPEG